MRFEVTSPDGRTVVLEGDTRPTDADLEEVFANLPEKKQDVLTPEQMEQAKQKSLEINKLLGVVNDDGSVKGSWVNSDWIRKPVAAMKGVANSSLNPAGFITKGLNYSFGNGKWELPESMQGFQSKDALERGIERGAEQANDYATMAVLGNALGASGVLGQGASIPSKLSRFALMQSPLDAAVTGAGGGLLSGSVNSSDPLVDFGLNVIGGSVANALQGGIKSGVKAYKKIKTQPKEITEESLMTAMGNKNSVQRMKESIRAGNTDLQTKAGSFAEKMTDYKTSKGRADIPFAEGGSGQLKEAITLPELKRAKANYDAFKVSSAVEKIPSETMNDFYKNHPFAKKTMLDVQKNTPSINKSNMNTIGSVDKLKSQLSRIARGSGENAGYAEDARQALVSIMENSSKGFREVNKAYAKAIAHQKNYENLLFTNAKQVANAVPAKLSQLTNMGIGGTLGAGLLTSNPYAVAAGLGILGAREAGRALKRQAGNAVAKGATPLVDLIRGSAVEYGGVAPIRAGIQAIIEKSLKEKKGE